MKLLYLCMLCIIFVYSNVYSRCLEKKSEWPIWGQQKNNSDDPTTPTYNMYCPQKKLVGCGAVAAGQVMWKYEWPLLSSYGLVDWDNIPAALDNGDPDDLPRLLRNIGKAVDMNYEEFLGISDWGFTKVTGSWCTQGDLEEGLEKYDYRVRRHKWTNWRNYGDSWNDLLKSELACGRPVIMYGQEDWGAFGMLKAHYFVVDDFEGWNSDKYSCNMGWRDGTSSDYADVDIRNSSDFKYHAEQQVYVISPKYPEMPVNVTSYATTVKNETAIYAKNSISLPAKGSSMSVESGATLVLAAGKEVKLNSGFTAKSGSVVRSIIKPEFQNDFEIKYRLLNNYIVPFCSKNDDYYVTYKVDNADSWECVVFDRNEKVLWRSAGLVENGYANVWDGSHASSITLNETYWLQTVFKNKYGRIIITNNTPILLSNEIVVEDVNPNQEILSPNCKDGINDNVVFKSECAERWEVAVFDRNYKRVWNDSGDFVDGYAVVWDGSLKSRVNNYERLFIQVNFKNSKGGVKEITKEIYYVANKCLRSLELFDEEIPEEYVDSSSMNSEELGEPMVVKDIKKEQGLNIYPNPTDGVVNLFFPKVTSGKIIVTDITGKVVLETVVKSKSSIRIDLSENISGVYMLKWVLSDLTGVDRVVLK